MSAKRITANDSHFHPDHPELPGINQGRQSPEPVLRPQLERDSADRPLGAFKAQGGHPDRFLVRVTSVRVRLLDEDNLCPKYLIDCCRYAGLLPDDSPDKVHIEVRQRKAAKGETEHSVVEIFNAAPPHD